MTTDNCIIFLKLQNFMQVSIGKCSDSLINEMIASYGSIVTIEGFPN